MKNEQNVVVVITSGAKKKWQSKQMKLPSKSGLENHLQEWTKV